MILTGITRAELEREFARLYRHYGVPERHDGQERLVIGDYLEALGRFPPEAVRAAVDRYIRTSDRWFPSVAKLVQLVRDECPRPVEDGVLRPSDAWVPPQCACGRPLEWLRFARSDGTEFERLECARHHAGGHPLYGARRTVLVGRARRPGEPLDGPPARLVQELAEARSLPPQDEPDPVRAKQEAYRQAARGAREQEGTQ